MSVALAASFYDTQRAVPPKDDFERGRLAGIRDVVEFLKRQPSSVTIHDSAGFPLYTLEAEE